MSPTMMSNTGQGVGMGMGLIGSVLSARGESQGLQSMADESIRQSNEQRQSNTEQQLLIDEEIKRRRMALGRDNVSPILAQQQAAMRGAGSLATGLGLNSADRAKIQSSLMPMQVLNAQNQADVQASQGNGASMMRLSSGMNQLRADQSDRSQLYDQLLGHAGRDGQNLRQWGEALQQLGPMASNYSMSKAPKKGGIGSSADSGADPKAKFMKDE